MKTRVALVNNLYLNQELEFECGGTRICAKTYSTKYELLGTAAATTATGNAIPAAGNKYFYGV